MSIHGGYSPAEPVTSLQQYLIVTAITLRLVMGGIDGSILPLGISSIVWDFGGDYASLLFLIEGVIFSGALIYSGRLGDQFGLKPVFLVGIACFTLGSFFSSMAGSMEWLMIFRLLSSVGLTLSLAVSLPIIMVYIPESRRGRSIGYTVMGMSIGSVIGPVVCGLILQNFSWGPMFLILVPIGLAILIISYFSIPHGTCHSVGIHDYPGLFLIFLTLGVFSIGMNLGLLDQNPVFFAEALIICLMSGFFFIMWEKRSLNPLIDLAFLTRKAIIIPLIIAFCIYCIYRVSLYFIPIYLSEILKATPFITGIIISIAAVIPAIGSPFFGLIIEKRGLKGIRFLLILSGFFGFLSCGSMIVTPVIGGLSAVYFSLIFLGIMFALGWPAVYGYYYSSVPLDHAGMAGGIIETVTEFSALMALSCVQLFFSAGVLISGGGSISARDIVWGSTPGVQSVYLFCFFLSVCIVMISTRISPE